MVAYAKTHKFQVVCPICKTREIIGLPESRLKKTSPLTTVSIHKGLICPHHFQFFLDKSFQIRGYQKVDLELEQESSRKLRNGIKVFKQNESHHEHNFENITLEENKVKHIPINNNKNIKDQNLKQEIHLKGKKLSFKEIYEEFWEYIDESNEIFLEFIKKDKRRAKYSINSDLNEMCII